MLNQGVVVEGRGFDLEVALVLPIKYQNNLNNPSLSMK